MTFLLDVNVLVALIDPLNTHHSLAHEWFSATGRYSWATCPLTENGTMRVVGNPAFPNSPGSPGAVVESLGSLVALPGHEFWPDDVSLLNCKEVDLRRILTAGQVTDTYLLALAATHGGQLATFDRRLVTSAVYEGGNHLHLIS